MTSIFSIGLSAVRAFGRKMETIAGNIANLYSQDYKKRRAVIAPQQHGGVKVDIEVQSPPDDRVELTEEIPQTTITQRGYEANIKTIAVENEMLGTLIDIFE